MAVPFADPREFLDDMILSMIRGSAYFGSPVSRGAWLVVIVCLAAPLPAVSRPEDIFIGNPGEGLRKSRPGVELPHLPHMESLECLDCHHDYQNGENVLDEDELDEDGSAACSACHTPEASIDLKRAYHRQCIQCHRDLNRQPGTGLPITCRDCHPRD
jgi:hypothetical protein